MKNTIRILILALLFGSCTVLSEDAAVPENDLPQPTVVIDNKIFDAGKVLKGETVKHVFTVKNTGNANLLIEDVKPG